MKEFDQQWLEKLDKIIEEHLPNPNFFLNVLANDLAISPAQLYRKVVAITGKSPSTYIREKRLLVAKDLLERGVYTTVSEVALAVGYLHPNNFSIKFEKEFGRRPSSYLK